MLRCIIIENFHVFARVDADAPERKIGFTKGLVVESDKVPDGHTIDDWIARGLAKAA